MSKFLGQHFLKNQKMAEDIVRLLSIEADDLILEIGPGKGALTRELAKKSKELGGKCQIVTIEKDKKLFESLKKDPQLTQIQFLYGDALDFLPRAASIFPCRRFKVIGNIPYYITGLLLRTLGEPDCRPDISVLTVQKEVAVRASSAPPKMNLLSASVGIWGNVSTAFFISKTEFSPPPKVNSAAIIITKKDALDLLPKEHLPLYYSLVRTLFKQPRKTVLNNFTAEAKRLGVLKKDAAEFLKKAGVDPLSRPQNLSLENILSLLFRIKLPAAGEDK